MIKVTRLNQSTLYVNSEHIEFIESTPDTVITLANDKKIVVVEPVELLVDRIVAFKKRCEVFNGTGGNDTGEVN